LNHGRLGRPDLGPLLSAEQASELLGSAVTLAALKRTGRLIALEKRSGETVYPAFQFVHHSVLPDLAAAHRILTRAESAWTAAWWCVNSHPELDGQSPRAWLISGQGPEQVLVVAERDATRLAA
jgi:hypothetical protein